MANIDTKLDELQGKIESIEKKIDLIMKKLEIPQPKKTSGIGYIPAVIKKKGNP